ncbi:MAG TPA: hypothetical protein VKY92_27940 [Verrucomicrobiae bacterium]|nr:hypothetical protein [Verrucomicrobiae bacterium]
MSKEDLELNRGRVQVIRLQLRQFAETLDELAQKVSQEDLRQTVSQKTLELQVMRDKLSGVDNFLSLLQPARRN